MERPLQILKKNIESISLEQIIMIGILILALVLRIWNLAGIPRFGYDEGDYCDVAENTANGRFMWWSHSFEGPAWYYMPLFFLFVATSFKIFGTGIAQARAISAIFGTLTCYLAYKFGKDILNNAKIGMLAAILYAIDMYALSIDRTALLDTTQSFFIALSIFFWYLNYKRSKQKYVLISGICAGLAILTKPTGAFAIFVIFGGILFDILKGKKELQQSLYNFFIVVCVCVFVVIPYLVIGNVFDPNAYQMMYSYYISRPQRGEAQAIFYLFLSIRSNPLIFGFGFIGVGYSIITKKKDSFLFLPWILIPTLILLTSRRLPLRYLSPLFLPLILSTAYFIINIEMQFNIHDKNIFGKVLEVLASPNSLLSVLVGLMVLIGLFNTLNSTKTIFTSEGDYEPQQVAEYLDLYVNEKAVIVGSPAVDFLSKKHIFHDMQALIENAERHGNYTLHQPLARKLDYLIIDPDWKYGWGISPELQEYLESSCVIEKTFGDTDLYRRVL